jgi:hypothetical protein
VIDTDVVIEEPCMAVSAEHRALHHAIDDLRTATTSLLSAHGDVPVVARLRNDLERLVLDVADADTLPAVRPLASPFSAGIASVGTERADSANEENYAPSAWDDVDDEGVGGFRGRPSGSTRR